MTTYHHLLYRSVLRLCKSRLPTKTFPHGSTDTKDIRRHQHDRVLPQLMAEVGIARAGRELKGNLGSYAGRWNLMQEQLGKRVQSQWAFEAMRTLVPSDLSEALLSELL